MCTHVILARPRAAASSVFLYFFIFRTVSHTTARALALLSSQLCIYRFCVSFVRLSASAFCRLKFRCHWVAETRNGLCHPLLLAAAAACCCCCCCLLLFAAAATVTGPRRIARSRLTNHAPSFQRHRPQHCATQRISDSEHVGKVWPLRRGQKGLHPWSRRVRRCNTQENPRRSLLWHRGQIQG